MNIPYWTLDYIFDITGYLLFIPCKNKNNFSSQYAFEYNSYESEYSMQLW